MGYRFFGVLCCDEQSQYVDIVLSAVGGGFHRQ
jgi:hypothetical protein